MVTRLCIVACFVGADAAFSCEDKSPECPQWKKNMGGDCKGQDFAYMLENCPMTCDICTEAEEHWNKLEEERKKSPTYEPDDSKVFTLTADTIDEFVEAYPLSLIMFYAPWCGHCQETAPRYREAANLLDQMATDGSMPQEVKLAKFDDSDPQNRDYGAGSEEMWNFTSYPSLYIIQDEEVDWYHGIGHEVEEFVHHMAETARGKNQTEARMSYGDIEKARKPGFYKPGGKHESDQITELDPDNFRDVVLRDDALWVVEFYSDKCPICNSLAPEIIKAGTKAQAEIPTLKYGACNSRVFDDLADKFGILSYPWVAAFYNGKKIEDMGGMGGWESFYTFGTSRHKTHYNPSTKPKLDAEIPPAPKRDKDGNIIQKKDGDGDGVGDGVPSDDEVAKQADPGEDEL